MVKSTKIGKRETIIGLGVLAILLMLLGAVVVKRLTGHRQQLAGAPDHVNIDADATFSADSPSNAEQPTVLKAQASVSQKPDSASTHDADASWLPAQAPARRTDDDAAFRPSYMPKMSAPDDRYSDSQTLVQPATPHMEATQDSADGVDDGATVAVPEKETVVHGDAVNEAPRVLTESPTLESDTAATATNDPSQSPGSEAQENDAHEAEPEPDEPSDETSPTASAAPAWKPTHSALRSASSGPQPVALDTDLRDASGGPTQQARQESATELPTRHANPGRYVVQPGDNMWIVSRKVYGSGAYFKALIEQNRPLVAMPHRLKVGDVILTPDLDELRQHFPQLCPKPRTRKPDVPGGSTVGIPANGRGRSYVVEEGDTLYDIARYELGDPSRWPEIFHLNRKALEDDYDHLQPGTQLVLPTREPDDQITRRPQSGAARY